MRVFDQRAPGWDQSQRYGAACPFAKSRGRMGRVTRQPIKDAPHERPLSPAPLTRRGSQTNVRVGSKLPGPARRSKTAVIKKAAGFRASIKLQRPPYGGAATNTSQFYLLGNAERILHLNAEIANGAFQLRLFQQKLDRPEVSCLFIDLRGLRSPHRMNACRMLNRPGQHSSPSRGRCEHIGASRCAAAHGPGWEKESARRGF